MLNNKWLIVILFVFLTFTNFANSYRTARIKSLKSIAEWKDLYYLFPSPESKQHAIAEGLYVPGNGVPIDVAVDYKDKGQSRIFVTIPRFVSGIPITLGTLSGQYENGNPLLQGYPDYYWHNRADCSGIISVFRVFIDKCQRLWVLDAGNIGDTQKCPPQILLFNLNNDQLIHRYVIPASQYKPGVSIFITPVVDVRDSTCSNTMVYIADTGNFGILVYDLRRNKSWRAENKLMYPTPKYGTFTIAGDAFDLMDGIFGMALSIKNEPSPKNFGGYFSQYNNNYNNYQNSLESIDMERSLYFHTLASITENSVPLSILDNSTIWEEDVDAFPRKFIEIGSRESQGLAQAMDKYGNLFFGLVNPIGIACWNSKAPYNVNNMRIVAHDDETLQFVSGLKVIENRKGKEELWALSSGFQKIAAGTRDPNAVIFRIQALEINELLSGTKCSAGGLPTSSFGFPYFS